ncbi:MAG: hypothetical protein ACR65R_12540 [Methylomicrobium sp.]
MKKNTILIGAAISIFLLSSNVIADPPEKVNRELQKILMKGKQESLKQDMDSRQDGLKRSNETERKEQKHIQELGRDHLKHQVEITP